MIMESGFQRTVRILFLVFLASVTCSGPTKLTGTATETENVAGVLFNTNGSRAAHAKVKFLPVDYTPGAGSTQALASADSTMTDDTGHYGVDSLPTNTYNLFFSGNGNLAFRDSIKVRLDSHIVVPPDTLKAPGSVQSRVRLQPGDDPRTVSILFLGTLVWSAPDDSTGKFHIANMAEGDYRVRFLTTYDSYRPKDTVLHFTAGKADTLAHDIYLQYTGIPIPVDLGFTYDTLRQIVSLIWNRPTTGRPVKSYKVYRKEQNATSFTFIKDGIPDTTYADSVGGKQQVFEYRVAAIDTNGTEGVKSSGVFVHTVTSGDLAAISAPAADAVWAAGSTYQIRWTPDSAVLGDSVSWYLYKGSKRLYSVAGPVPNSGIYLFAVPSDCETGNDYRVRIENRSDALLGGFSALFTISGLAPDVYEPDGSRESASFMDSLGKAQPHNLTLGDTDWVKFTADSGIIYLLQTSGAAATNAYLFYGNDASYSYLFSSSTTTSSFLQWRCVKSGVWYVRISSNASTTDGGTYSLTISKSDSLATVFFSSPPTGVVWTAGSFYQIKWTPDTSLLGKRVYLQLHKGSQWIYAIADSAPNSGQYAFTLPSGCASGDDYRIGIARNSDNVIAGYSPLFTISGMAPDAYEPDNDRKSASTLYPLETFQNHNLTINDTDWVKFTADSGSLYKIQTSGTILLDMFLLSGNDSAFSSYFTSTLEWPCMKSGVWYVRIGKRYLGTSPTLSGTYSLTISKTTSTPAISIISPAATAIWNAGTSYQIKWTPDSSIIKGSRVSLSLYKGSQEMYYMCVNTPNGGAHTTELIQELISGSDYRIKVVIYSNTTLEGYSDLFTIRGITPDAYEPDNNREFASTLDSISRYQYHSMESRDTDWVKFTADSGVFYDVHATGDVPTKFYLFYGNDTSCAAYFSDPRMQPWVCPKTGVWYARISLNDTGHIYDARRLYSFSLSYFDSLRNVNFICPPTTSPWNEGSAQRIQWAPDSANLGDSVILGLYKGDIKVAVFSGGQESVRLPNSGYIDWTVPQGLATGSDYRIALDRASSPSHDGFFDFSLPFTIIGTAGIQSLRR
jgi:hypothetical protein